MTPVAINNKGDVLCYTRFVKNEMGARFPMPISYGYCILTQDTIIQYTMKVLEWDDKDTDMEAYNAEYKLWESIFKGPFRERYLVKAVREKYGFTEAGVNDYKVNKTMSVADFNKMKNINLYKTRQKALLGVVSKNNYSQQKNKVHVLYDFGNIVLLQNNILETEEIFGSKFNYINSYFVDVGYEESKITGVIFTNDRIIEKNE